MHRLNRFFLKNLIYSGVILSFFVSLTSADPVPTTIDDFFLPGSQPEQSGSLISPNNCDNCHGGYNAAVEPAFTWRGSMMSQAMRDPLFLATMSIANQDAPESGDLCLRCHTTGWLEGRSIPTNGSALTVDDREGVQCDFCHKFVKPTQLGVNPYPGDPDYTSGTYPADQTYLATLDQIPEWSANGMYITDSDNARRGPYNDADANHDMYYSPFHNDAEQCGTCHDVSNPVFTGNPEEGYAPNAFGQPAPDFDLRTMFPVERTFSEWTMSEYNTPGGVYAPQFGGNQDYVSTCQDCHMKDVTGKGCNKNWAIVRDDLGMHDLTGGNTFVPNLIEAVYPGEADLDALAAGVERATYMLQNAATLELTVEPEGANFLAEVTVTNETGHKLPSGYPEGRRTWLNLKAYDAVGTVIYESGAYDETTGVLTEDPDIKKYEIKPGISTGLAPVVNLPAAPSFHFVLNDTVYKDNRIPPRGFTNANFEAIQSPAVGYSYDDGQYWDASEYTIPGDAAEVEVTLYYQTTSKEYIEFLRDENTTDDWGNTMYDLWVANGMCPPVAMAIESYTITSSVPDFTVGLTYLSGSPVPAGGGELLFDVFLANNETTTENFDLWIEIPPQIIPPAVPNRNLTFPGGFSLTRPNMPWPIPASWPAGNYDMVWNVGVLTTLEVWVTDSFPFEKSAVEDGDGYTFWEIEGDPLDQLLEGIDLGEPLTVSDFAMLKCYPNPFNPNTTISYNLDAAVNVKLSVYDLSGREIAKLADGYRDAGMHEVNFDASGLASGIYIYRLTSSEKTASGKMVLMK